MNSEKIDVFKYFDSAVRKELKDADISMVTVISNVVYAFRMVNIAVANKGHDPQIILDWLKEIGLSFEDITRVASIFALLERISNTTAQSMRDDNLDTVFE